MHSFWGSRRTSKAGFLPLTYPTIHRLLLLATLLPVSLYWLPFKRRATDIQPSVPWAALLAVLASLLSKDPNPF